MNLSGSDCYRKQWDTVDETQTVLVSLRGAFAAAPAPFSPIPMKKRLSAEEQEAWQHLQATIPDGTVGYADITCLLAYCGIDYSRNVRRLMRPYTLQGSAGSGVHRGRSSAIEAECGAHLPAHLARLYDRWRDPLVLKWLLDLRRPGRAERDAGHQALACLWDDHRTALLREASTSAGRRARLAEALLYTCRILDEPLIWRAYARHLRQALYSRDLSLRRAALGILAHLRKHADIRAEETLSCQRRTAARSLVAL